MDNERSWARRSACAQYHGPVLEARASHRRSRRRPVAVKTFLADFRNWGISRMGNISRSTRALEMPTTNYDSRLASSAIPSTRA
jgi:hypothetical protein